eukprot:CAMPEP_0172505170 /NCGR_PEP_ID=MMETSP1066-20121228/184151_1 /TAXON_ID=671091 /ORGANISM="Coscinodiscus wailesii, Strain CCMP2513" /LENGTH=464 /DNA_ID=CAMNT_0013281667 /DNA_START=56 /DNA_END=1450 /DNA_ORIENTATION=+
MLRRLKSTVVKTTAAGIITVGVVEITTHLPSQGRSSEFYHKMSDSVVTPLLRSLLPPEAAHHLAIECLKRDLAPRYRTSTLERHSLKSSIEPFSEYKNLSFPNCVGLAAGFDKDGVAIRGLFDVGFGFVEIGSVTPLPQPGNPSPRMFRLLEDRGVINRYGFNSVGVDEVERNLKDFRHGLSVPAKDSIEDDVDNSNVVLSSLKHVLQLFKNKITKVVNEPQGLVGINLGKNKTSEDDVADYVKGIKQLGPYADYIVINISSPNTPNLRSLQKSEPLHRLLTAAARQRDELPQKIPLLVKIAPDLTDDDIADIARAVTDCGIDGIVVCNTTVSRPASLVSRNRDEGGGLSGEPLRALSTEIISKMYRLTDGTVPIVGVGGVGCGHDVYEKLKAGASLVQVYSMMVYEGPGVVSRIRHELSEIMLENGIRSVEDVVGLDHEDIYMRKRLERIKESRSTESVIIDE